MKDRIIKNQKLPKSLFNIIPMVKDKDGVYKVKKHNLGEIYFQKTEPIIEKVKFYYGINMDVLTAEKARENAINKQVGKVLELIENYSKEGHLSTNIEGLDREKAGILTALGYSVNSYNVDKEKWDCVVSWNFKPEK